MRIRRSVSLSVNCRAGGTRNLRVLPQVGTLCLTAAMAGCSADVARFDSPSFSVNGPASMPRPTEPLRRDTSFLGGGGAEPAPMPPPVARDTTALADPVATARPGPAPVAPIASRPMTVETVEVAQGDTLYGLSRRHHVSLADLMAANNLSNPNLKPGQKLVVPYGGVARRPLPRSTTVSAVPPVAPAALPPPAAPVGPVAAAAPSGDWSGTYAVKPGDSLYGVAHRAKVKVADLERVNGITDPRKVRPGTVLRVPAGSISDASAVAQAAPAPAATSPVAPLPPVAEASPLSSTTTRPTIINGQSRVADLGGSVPDTPPVIAAEPKVEPKVTTRPTSTTAILPAAAADNTSKLRWPVRGKVIASFGTRPDGTHNDGINIAVPLGTEIHAADNGVVAFAGEIKGYGNIVLIRHDNGWVTAYAHNEEILVKRSETVKRGQVLAKAGRSGEVDQPQVHFELRQGSKPVDPTPYLDQL
jgi:murein DD-endopeptidase MepM/ murein hydrolase activator NlpD